MKKLLLIFTLIFVLNDTSFAEKHSKTIVSCKQTWESGKQKVDYIELTYIDNFCYINGEGPLIQLKDSEYGNYRFFAELERSDLSPNGRWLNGYGPDSIEIISKSKTEASEAEISELYIQLINGFRNTYLRNEKVDDTILLARFCDLLDSFTKSQLRILRNTIYANHNYKFKSDDLNKLFNACSWYKADPISDERDFSYCDYVYLKLIKLAEQKAN